MNIWWATTLPALLLLLRPGDNQVDSRKVFLDDETFESWVPRLDLIASRGPSSITGSHRDKRFEPITLATAAGVASIAGAIFSGGSFFYGIGKGQKELHTLRSMRKAVIALNRKVDASTQEMRRISGGLQEMRGRELAELRNTISSLNSKVDASQRQMTQIYNELKPLLQQSVQLQQQMVQQLQQQLQRQMHLQQQLDQQLRPLLPMLQLVVSRQQWVYVATQYSKYTQRLDYFKNELNHMQLQADGTVGTDHQSTIFKAQVLGTGGLSANECLHHIHNMIMGSSTIFPQQSSMIEMFKDGAPSNNQQSQRWFVQAYIHQLVALEIAGYTAWFTALNMQGKQNEIPSRQAVMNQRFAQQNRLFETILAQSNDVYGKPVPHTLTLTARNCWDQSWVPKGRLGNVPRRPLRGCQLYRKGVAGSDDIFAIRCIDNKLQAPTAEPHHPIVIGNDYIENRDNVPCGLWTPSPKYVSDEWVMVPDPKNWAVCGVQLANWSNRLALIIMACTKDMKHQRTVYPINNGNSQFLRDRYVDGQYVTPEPFHGWITGMRLYKNGNSIALQLKTSYQ